jgi:hypothetical protein
MSTDSAPPNFKEFTRWVRAKVDIQPGSSRGYEKLLAEARTARDHALRTLPYDLPSSSIERDYVEVLHLLAASSGDDNSRPPELTTAKGFRVTLAYDEESSRSESSICVLVQSPVELIGRVQGQTAYLWNGAERFQLGQFDVDGKAIGTLPAGLEITLSDFASGNVKLDAPGSSSDT